MGVTERIWSRLLNRRSTGEPHSLLQIVLVDGVFSLRSWGFEAVKVGDHRRNLNVLSKVLLSQ